MAAKSAFSQFLEDNTKGPVNKAFLGLSIAEIAQADNKLKALVKTIASLLLWKPLLAVGLAGAFGSMGKSIRTLVKDSGALDAAMRRLSSIQTLHRSLGALNGSRVFDFAKTAGRDLGAVTDAVTGFKRALQSGDSVNDAADGLRQMGLASEATIGRLRALQQGGANSTKVFNEFTRSLRENATQQKTVAGIAEANRAAREGVSAAFGSGYVGSELKNQQNQTDALNALQPRVGRVSKTWANMFGGFSTAKSALGKWAAQNPAVGAIGEGLGHALPFAALAGQAFGISTLAGFTGKLARSGLLARGAAAAGTLGRVSRFARFGLRGVPYVGAALMLAELGGAAYNYMHQDENEKLAKEAEEKKGAEEDAARREGERGRYVRRGAVDREVAGARARLAGNNEQSVRLDNLGNFAGEYERLRGEFGAAGAQSRALALTSAQIAEQGAAPVASSLARVGLGGEFGGGSDVQKQIRDLNKGALEYLKAIDAKLGGTPVANEPADDQDY